MSEPFDAEAIARHVESDTLKRLDAYTRGYLSRAALPVRADIRALLEESRRKDKALEMAARELSRLAVKATAAEDALAEWRKHDSAPDCVACAALTRAALDAALAGGEE